MSVSGGAAAAAYRFSGVYSGDDFGIYAFDIDAGGAFVSGAAYSVPQAVLMTVTGAVAGGSLTATATATTGAAMTFSGTIALNAGALDGGWSGSAGGGQGGVFSGSGCRLN